MYLKKIPKIIALPYLPKTISREKYSLNAKIYSLWIHELMSKCSNKVTHSELSLSKKKKRFL